METKPLFGPPLALASCVGKKGRFSVFYSNRNSRRKPGFEGHHPGNLGDDVEE
jgi:hypothetical protein